MMQAETNINVLRGISSNHPYFNLAAARAVFSKCTTCKHLLLSPKPPTPGLRSFSC